MTPSIQENGRTHVNRAGVSESDRHRLLANERRRIALDVLELGGEAVDIEELAREVATLETAGDVDQSIIDDVALSLHHVHLPMMNDLGVVDYDATLGRVEPRRYPRDT